MNIKISLLKHGRTGIILYQEDKRQIEIEYELSGSPKFDILFAPVDLNYWKEPYKQDKIKEEDQIEILDRIREWLEKRKIRSDISYPNGGETKNEYCEWVNCTNPKLVNVAFCKFHFNRNLLKKV